eukprot:TRINITY_DN9944_c0_g1_i1.p1 TRINITY_DN9944_c0_g1~~TRINITY_DN9944_c0_g1_i1.p1  ORF type:complete len:262 (-),score=47.04 TRINITY_DN9944_c0_g1_i1:354-1031(-)
MGFTEAAGDCLAFKYFRDAEEKRTLEERQAFVDKGLQVAVTDSARERLFQLRGTEPEKVGTVADEAEVEVVRLTKEDVACRLVPLAGAYEEASAQALRDVPKLGGNGGFDPVNLPEQGGSAVLLPRWNVIALARRPAVLSINDASKIPELASGQVKDPSRIKGQAYVVVEVGDSEEIDEASYYMCDVNGVAKLVQGSEARDPIGRVMMACLPARSSPMVPSALDA